MSLANAFDLAMLLVVVYFAARGLFRGFFSELFSLVGMVSGVYFGFQYGGVLDELLRGWFAFLNPSLCKIIAIALIFFAVCVVCSLIGQLLSAILSMAALGSLDSLCGLIAGAAKGAAVVTILVVILGRASRFLPGDLLRESRAAALVNDLLPHVERYIDRAFPNESKTVGDLF